MKKLLSFIATICCIILVSCLCPKSDTYIRNSVVKLAGNGAYCSGEQVVAPSGRSFVLTAAHCLALSEGGYITATDEYGESHRLAVIEEDPASDLLLLDGVPGLNGLQIANIAPRFSKVRTFTHGSGLPTYETEGYLVGKTEARALLFMITTPEEMDKCKAMPAKLMVISNGIETGCLLFAEEEVTTASIVPGSSGGAIVNSEGDLVGVASATDGKFGYLVTLSDIHRFLKSH